MRITTIAALALTACQTVPVMAEGAAEDAQGDSEFVTPFSCVNVDELLEVEAENESMKINNVTFSARESYDVENIDRLEVNYSVVNKTDQVFHISGEFVFLAENVGVVAALSASPRMSMVRARTGEQARGYVYVAPGRISKADMICFNFTGG